MPPPDCIDEQAALAVADQALAEKNNLAVLALGTLQTKETALNTARTEYEVAYNLWMQTAYEVSVAEQLRDQAAQELENCQNMQMQSQPPPSPEVS